MISNNVRRGMDWLMLFGNIRAIDLDTLDVESVDMCPLVQSGHGWDATRRAYGIDWLVDHGFALHLTFLGDVDACGNSFADLTAEWRRQITEYRVA